MSSRVTRSSARLAADPPAAIATPLPTNPLAAPSTTSKKRKAPARPDSSLAQTSTETTPQSSTRRSKRQKVADTPPQRSPTAPQPRTSRRRGAVTETAMSNTGYGMQGVGQDAGLIKYRTSSKQSEELSKAPQAPKTASNRPSSRSKKSQGTVKTLHLQPYELTRAYRNFSIFTDTNCPTPEEEAYQA
jgi:E3 ubiquitin-protein ligase TRIP12